MKKTISIILTLLIIVTILLVNCTAATFKDVSDSAYYAIAAKKLSEKKILEGYPDGTFGPQRLITRAEMAAVVCRMINVKLNTQNLKSPFADVPDNHWAIPYIVAASNEKIINGDGDGTFRPEENVRHEEAIKMVVCALKMVPADIKTDPVDWSAPYLKIAEEKGISANLMGKKGEKSTRADVAVMVYNGIIPTVNPPVASIGAGTYKSGQKIILKSDKSDAKIYYTLNGETPTTESVEYLAAIVLNKDCTLKAIAVYDDVASDVLTIDYKIDMSTGSNSNGNGKFDFEGSEEIGGSHNNNKPGNDDDQGPSQEEKDASALICEELAFTLEAIENIPFDGKAADIMSYVKMDIAEELDKAAADENYIVSNIGVRILYADDIEAIKTIINSMTSDEKAAFKQEILKIDTFSLMTLADFFDINTSYLG